MGKKKKQTQGLLFLFGSECWGMKLKTIEYRFKQNSLNKVGRVASKLLELAQVIDHTA